MPQVFTRYVVSRSEFFSGKKEAGRYEDPAVAWADIRTKLEAHPENYTGKPPEYSVEQVMTHDSRTYPIK